MFLCQHEGMKRITIAMPDDVAHAISREAKRRDVSTSEVIRVAVIAQLGLGTRRRELPFANLGSSGEPDIAERMEEILAEEWGRDLGR